MPQTCLKIHHEHSHDVYDKHRHFVSKAEHKLSAVCRYSDSCSAVTVATVAGEIQSYVVAGEVQPAWACSPAACITQGRQLAAVRSEVSIAVVTCSNPCSNPCSSPFLPFLTRQNKFGFKAACNPAVKGCSIRGSRQPVILSTVVFKLCQPVVLDLPVACL